jgi:putative oxidoreductase
MNTDVANTAIAVNSSQFTTVSKFTELGGRILLATMFLLSGLSKLGAPGAAAALMKSAGLSPDLLPLVIITEIGGAVALIAGYRTRVAAFFLAGFTFLTAVFFHHNFADQEQMINFMKNMTIVGGMLVVVARGSGPLSLDWRKANRASRA